MPILKNTLCCRSERHFGFLLGTIQIGCAQHTLPERGNMKKQYSVPHSGGCNESGKSPVILCCRRSFFRIASLVHSWQEGLLCIMHTVQEDARKNDGLLFKNDIS